MLTLKKLFYYLLDIPLRLRVSLKVLPKNFIQEHNIDLTQPLFYVIRHQSASDILTLRSACLNLDLPDPLDTVNIKGEKFHRTICLDKPSSLFHPSEKPETSAIHQGLALLKQHQKDEKLNAQLVPANLIWGRKPQKYQWKIDESSHHSQAPNWFKKLIIIMLRGSHTLVRFSQAIPFKTIQAEHGSDLHAAKKLLRIARVHFYKQNIAAKGPRALSQKQVFQLLLANPAIKEQIKQESENKKTSPAQIEKEALTIMQEIAGDYSDLMVRIGDRVLGWLWRRLYSDIEVNHTQELQSAAEAGHEILYIPCHRSHMDYLLLTYVIFHQGLATPRIAAGINLNFWPAGPIFRKAGAFFIRRSFKGNRLYATVFREYLSLLFERGYPVKYYTEGGRSRTGKLLAPKTGMISMTFQSLLKGINRPLTLVPVYLGYEHVMEVGTYHQELSGSKKEKESILGVVKAIRSLRDYGRGYVNFGKPINLNNFLNEHEPQWKENLANNTKPQWLTTQTNNLAEHLMYNINENAALNGTALVALILLASKQQALPKNTLTSQVSFLLKLQSLAPFSSRLTLPQQSAETLVDEVIALNKVTLTQDSFGSVVSLSPAAKLDMRYYRNNILHTFLLPALICSILCKHQKIKAQELTELTQSIISLLKDEFFIYQTEQALEQHTQKTLEALLELKAINKTKAGYLSLVNESSAQLPLETLGEVIQENLQRIMIIVTLLQDFGPLSTAKLNEKAQVVVQRLNTVNDVSMPEFNDAKTQNAFLNTPAMQALVTKNEQGEYQAQEELSLLQSKIAKLINPDVRLSLESLC